MAEPVFPKLPRIPSAVHKGLGVHMDDDYSSITTTGILVTGTLKTQSHITTLEASLPSCHQSENTMDTERFIATLVTGTLKTQSHVTTLASLPSCHQPQILKYSSWIKNS